MRLRATTVAVEGICTVSGAETVTGLLTANGGLTLVGGVFGANPITKVAYKSTSGAATEASNTTNNPVIYICTADPAADCTDGDIWIQR